MKQVTTRVSKREYEHLARFCEATERTQSDVIRELIRKLSISGVLNPIDWPPIHPDTNSTEYGVGLPAKQLIFDEFERDSS